MAILIPDIAMTTCKRPHDYVSESLASMFRSDPLALQANIRLVVDGNDADFLGDNQERAELLSEEDRAWLSGKTVSRRILFATTRALVGANPDRPLVLLQDDVSFQPEWLRRAIRIADDATARHGEKFVCALWGTYRRGGAMFGDYTVYPPQCFYGNVALFIAQPVVREMAEHFKSCVDTSLKPDDMEVKRFMSTEPYPPLFLALPNLVEHRGEVSTRG